jgi:Polysaccharide biosynthesis protein.
MNRTKKFMYNTVASAFQQIVVMAVGLILPRVMLECYGSVVNGLTSSITQFINYFTLVEAGIGASAVYALYKPLAENDHPAISSIVTAAQKFYILSGYLFTALTFILAFCFPFIRKTNVLSPLEIGILVLVLGVSGTLDFFVLSKYNVLLTADQRYYVISISSTVATMLNAVIIVALAYSHVSVLAARTAALLSVSVRALILYSYVRKKYNYLNFHAKPDNSAMRQRWDALYLQILGAVQTGAPVILATIFINYEAASVYSIYYMVIGAINGLLSIFTSGLSASFGDVIVRGEKEKLQTTYKQFEFTYYALITFVYACALVLIMPFIRIYTKGIVDADYNVPLVGYFMVLNGFLYNLKTPQGMLVVSAGLFRETKWQSTIQGAIAIVVGAALAPKFGLPGILTGLIMSNLYRDIDLLLFIPAHVTQLSPKRTLKRWANSFMEFIVILIPFFYITIFAANFLQWTGWGIVTACYALVVVLIFSFIFDRTEFKNSLVRILKMIGAKK